MTRSRSLERVVVDTLWSLWTELGVPGTLREHKTLAIDPESLIVFTPYLGATDSRLLEQAQIWCGRHHRHVSKSRIIGTAKKLGPAPHSHFQRFARQLHNLGVTWATPKQKTPRSKSPMQKAKKGTLPLDRPALTRIRARALCGVGARTEVLCELVAAAQSDMWVTIPDLYRLGFTQPKLFNVFSNLQAAGMLKSHSPSRTKRFALRHITEFQTLIAAHGLSWPTWPAIFEITAILLALEQTKGSKLLKNVEANDARERLDGLLWQTTFPEPPKTQDNPQAWKDLLSWGKQCLLDLASHPTK